MPIGRFVEYEDAPPEVRAVYDDIMASRGVDWVNNFWKALAQHPRELRAVVGMASETNALVEAYKVEVDARLHRAARKT